MAKWPLTIINIGILFALFLCLVTFTFFAYQLNNWHRMTNLLLFTMFLLMTGVWFALVLVQMNFFNSFDFHWVSVGTFVLPLFGLTELICFFISRRFMAQLYDAKFLEDLLADTDDEEERTERTNSLLSLN